MRKETRGGSGRNQGLKQDTMKSDLQILRFLNIDGKYIMPRWFLLHGSPQRCGLPVLMVFSEEKPKDGDVFDLDSVFYPDGTSWLREPTRYHFISYAEDAKGHIIFHVACPYCSQEIVLDALFFVSENEFRALY